MSKPGIDWNKIGLWIAFSLPVLLLLTVFFYNRSLFLDSLNLARNIAEASFSELSRPLKYQQSAPLLFLYISKVSTLLFGISEYTLRLFPVISGLACLFFYKKTLERCLPLKYVLIGVLWLGTHSMFIRYATEFKQYITDAFVSIFLIWLALYLDKLTKKNILYIGFLGAVSIWLSMPSIFVLFGLVCYYFYLQYQSKSSLLPVFILGVWFLFNFLLEYFLILSPAIHSDHMQNFHQNFFLQGALWKPESMQHDFGLLISMLRMSVGKSGLSIAVALILIGASVYDFFINRKSHGLLFVMPIVAMFGASLLGKYSLIERLMLFAMPIIFILILLGFQVVITKIKDKNAWLKYSMLGIIGLAFVAGFAETQGIKYVFEPLQIEDNRSSLIHIGQHEKHKNSIVCTQLAFPAYSYYTQYDKNLKSLSLGKAIGAKYNESVVALAIEQSNKEHEEIWVLMGHMPEHEISNLIVDLNKAGTIKNSYRTKSSAAILFSTQ